MTTQIADGFFPVPLLSPYVAYGAEPRMLQLIKKEIEEKKKSGSKDEQIVVRVSSASRNNIIVWDKESLKEIYLTKANSFTKPIDYLYEALNIFDKNTANLLTAHDGDEWKRHHRVVATSFTTENLKHLCNVTNETADLMFRTRWDPLLEKQKEGIMLDVHVLSDITLEGEWY